MSFRVAVSCLFVLVFGQHSSNCWAGPVQEFLTEHCMACHDANTRTAKFDVTPLLEGRFPDHTIHWEQVVKRLETRQMPPADSVRPSEDEYKKVLAQITAELDGIYEARPQMAPTETFRRLTRTEYQNAIRDLLGLQIDAKALLPADESSHGFDNITVADLSPTLLNRYLSAAQEISRLAVGSPTKPMGKTFRIRPDATQEKHRPGLPLGTRGGAVISHTFPSAGEFRVTIRLARDRNEHVEGLRQPHEMDILLDRKRLKTFTVKPPKGQNHATVDQHLNFVFASEAGEHNLGVTFWKKPNSLLVTRRQPTEAHFNKHRHPRLSPAVFQISVTGPFSSNGVGNTETRKRIVSCEPESPSDEDTCAETTLRQIMLRAYRRPITERDLVKAMAFYREGRETGDFYAGIELALSSILVNPNFLFRIEQPPAKQAAGETYPIDDFTLASRLSFFLWSSLPDDRLLDLAEAGTLHRADVLEREVRRMLQDPKSQSLITNFASQWLYLRNLDSFTPDLRLFPDFDDNLRQALRTETELFFQSILKEDRGLRDLLRADYTYLNERLARHYGIPHVAGSRFRRVELDDASHRGGLLRQGSILAVTSYATRTSPVIRGHWVLKNLLGCPPPPPPADVPALKENTVGANLSVRERLAEHRKNAACASCHNLMDPVGLALENYDAVGRWRETEFGSPIDNAGGFPDGSTFRGVDGLEAAILARPELFATTFTEKLLTFALGRGVDERDAPAIRKIVRTAAKQDYRLSDIIVGVTQSVPFLRKSFENPTIAKTLADENPGSTLRKD